MDTFIERNFTYHVPVQGQLERYQAIRHIGAELAKVIIANCPDIKEREFALHYVDMAVMNANASIARGEA